MNGSFSSLNEVNTGVPQGSILGALLFSRFLNDIFLFISKCRQCNYDNTFYQSEENMQKLENRFMNHMLLNSDKCHYIMISVNEPSH